MTALVAAIVALCTFLTVLSVVCLVIGNAVMWLFDRPKKKI
jgi:hypothetical protein